MTVNPSLIFEEAAAHAKMSKHYHSQLKQLTPKLLVTGEYDDFSTELNKLDSKYVNPYRVITMYNDWQWFDLGNLESLASTIRKDVSLTVGAERLPFPRTIVSFSGLNPRQDYKPFDLFLFCQYLTDEHMSVQLVSVANSNVSLVARDLALYKRETGYEVETYNSFNPTLTSTRIPTDEADHVIVAIVVHFMKILACSNVVKEKEEFPKKLNKKRAANGSYKGFDKYILKIVPSQYVKEPSLSLGGTHASPRLHFRRGHIRHLPTGMTVWVRDCMVGKAELGIVDKDYKINVLGA